MLLAVHEEHHKAAGKIDRETSMIFQVFFFESPVGVTFFVS